MLTATVAVLPYQIVSEPTGPTVAGICVFFRRVRRGGSQSITVLMPPPRPSVHMRPCDIPVGIAVGDGSVTALADAPADATPSADITPPDGETPDLSPLPAAPPRGANSCFECPTAGWRPEPPPPPLAEWNAPLPKLKYDPDE